MFLHHYFFLSIVRWKTNIFLYNILYLFFLSNNVSVCDIYRAVGPCRWVLITDTLAGDDFL